MAAFTTTRSSGLSAELMAVVDTLTSQSATSGWSVTEDDVQLALRAAETDASADELASIYESLRFRGIEVRPSAGEDGLVADIVLLYLREVDRFDPLSAEEQARLAALAAEGARATERLETPGAAPAPDEECLLKEAERVGREAKEALVSASLRLVIPVARSCAGRGLPFIELVQEGNFGLLRAAEEFGQARDTDFSAYATKLITLAIKDALTPRMRISNIPVATLEAINSVLRVRRRLQQELGREPTVDEVLQESGFSPERLQEVERILASFEPEDLSLLTEPPA